MPLPNQYRLSDLLQQPAPQQPDRLNGMLSNLQQTNAYGLGGLLGPPMGALSPATANQGMLAQAQARSGQNNDPSWYREDGTKKGRGFLGLLPFHNGKTSSELAIGVNLGGKEMQIPSLVPTLNPQEIMHLLNGGPMTDSIVQKAVEHAKMRMQNGLSPFAD